MGKMLNFDLFMNEKEKATIDVTVFGDHYQVPMEIPAIVPVMMARAEESMNQQDSTKMVMLAADALFGKENVNRMCQKGMTGANLAALVERLFREISGTSEEDTEAEELTEDGGRVVATEGRNGKK